MSCQPWDKQCNLSRQCQPTDFECQAMKDEELYSFLVGHSCRDQACTQKGLLPSEVLYEVFKACNEEAGGDAERFVNCLLDMRDLVNEALSHAREVLRK